MEEREEGLTYEDLTILRLKNSKEKIQGILGVVTALVSMYLFSVLSPRGAEQDNSCTWRVSIL